MTGESIEVLLGRRDPETIRTRWLPILEPVVRRYNRAEVRGIDHIPEGGALVVSNHSGGFITMDFPVLLVFFAERFGVERPIHLLSHGVLGLFSKVVGPLGLLPAERQVAIDALAGGTTLMVFPGGDRDVSRPTSKANVIDFHGRTGYVRTALEADVPIVPMVSVGGQETQWFLPGGEVLAKLLMFDRFGRLARLPVSIGFPFGPSIGIPMNLPLPSKLTAEVLAPIHVRDEFGSEPDAAEVDDEVRRRMQVAIDALAAERRFPVIG